MAKEITVMKKLLHDRYMTQKEFAKLVGLNLGVVNSVANVARKAYPVEAKKIADGLGVPEEELFDERGFAKTTIIR
jgi:transcriptional regulator with XRE-family HTH domain